jgi:hypothetical protein
LKLQLYPPSLARDLQDITSSTGRPDAAALWAALRRAAMINSTSKCVRLTLHTIVCRLERRHKPWLYCYRQAAILETPFGKSSEAPLIELCTGRCSTTGCSPTI